MISEEIVIDVSKKSLKPLWVGIGLFIGVLVVVGIGSQYFPVSTHVSLEVAVNRAEWTLGLFPSPQIFEPIMVESISFQNFSHVEFKPSSLHVADPDQYDRATGQFSPSAWEPVTVFGDVRLTPKNQETFLRIQSLNPAEENLGRLSSIHVREQSNVTIEIAKTDPRKITVNIVGPESSVEFTPTKPFEMIANEIKLAGLKEFPFFHKSSLTFRPELPGHRTHIEIQGTKHQLVITLTVSPSQHSTVLSKQAIPIKAIEFSRQDDSGQTVTTLIGPGKLEFPEISEFSAKTIQANDFVYIEPYKILKIHQITLLHNQPGFKFSLDGTAKSIQTGPNESLIDHRASLSDWLLNHFHNQ